MDKEFEPIATVKLSRIQEVLRPIRKHVRDLGHKDCDVGFEYLMAALFPEQIDQFQENLKDAYSRGYVDGYRDKEIEYDEQA